jgi:uroporphyrinogen-III synthase
MRPQPAIIITRPEPGAARTASLLRNAGFETVVSCPLTRIEPLPFLVPAWHGRAAGRPKSAVFHDALTFDALIFSSQNGVRHFAARPESAAFLMGLPVYCVGERTAKAARARGATIAAMAETADALIAHVIAGNARSALYPCGAVRRPDLETGLGKAAILVHALTVYDALPVDGAARAVEHHLAEHQQTIVLLYAPSAAALLDRVAMPESGSVVLACLSEAVRQALAPQMQSIARVAAQPNEAALMQIVEECAPGIGVFVAGVKQAS